MDVVFGDALDSAARFDGTKRLIVVDHQRSLGADEFSDLGDGRHVLLDRAVAKLDLDAAETGFDGSGEHRCIGLGVEHAETVISHERSWLSPKKSSDRPTDRFSQRVPESHVQAGDRHANKTLPAKKAKAAIELAHPLKRNDRLAAQLIADLLYQTSERREGGRRVSEEVCAPGHAFLGEDVDQYERRRGNRADRGPDRAFEWRSDGPRLNRAHR